MFGSAKGLKESVVFFTPVDTPKESVAPVVLE
jgi:hypothetical protein